MIERPSVVGPQASGLRSTLLAAGIATVILVVLLLIFRSLASSLSVGARLYDEKAIEGLRDTVKLVQDGSIELLKLTTTAFGAIAFLVTYQQKKGTPVATPAWAALGVGLVSLVGALLFSLLSLETIATMVGNNAIDLGLRALQVARWFVYGCLMCAAVSISLFALRIVTSTSLVSNPN